MITTGNETPLSSGTFTDVWSESGTDAFVKSKLSWFIGTFTPIDISLPWRFAYRIKSSMPDWSGGASYEYGLTDSVIELDGVGNELVNHDVDTSNSDQSYRSHYNAPYAKPSTHTQTDQKWYFGYGIDGSYNAYGTSAMRSSYHRTVIVDILVADNVTYSLFGRSSWIEYGEPEGMVAVSMSVVTSQPTKISELENDLGFGAGGGGGISEETDPTVSAWAKAATKPTYTAAEVGALPSNGTASKATKLAETDTRDRNEPPSWYMANHPNTLVSEFKGALTIGITGASSYCALLTMVVWGDASGGYPTQIALASNGIFYRIGVSSTTWSAWHRIPGSSSGTKLTWNDLMGN